MLPVMPSANRSVTLMQNNSSFAICSNYRKQGGCDSRRRPNSHWIPLQKDFAIVMNNSG